MKFLLYKSKKMLACNLPSTPISVHPEWLTRESLVKGECVISKRTVVTIYSFWITNTSLTNEDILEISSKYILEWKPCQQHCDNYLQVILLVWCISFGSYSRLFYIWHDSNPLFSFTTPYIFSVKVFLWCRLYILRYLYYCF